MPQHATRTSYKKGDPRLMGNPWGGAPKGTKLSESHRKKLIEAGKKTRFKKGQISRNKGKPLSEETKKKLSESAKKRWREGGKYNPNGCLNVFGGFKRTTHRKSIFRRKLVEEIGKCEICGFDDKRALVSHHKDGDYRNNTRENLLLLCANCHYIKHNGFKR